MICYLTLGLDLYLENQKHCTAKDAKGAKEDQNPTAEGAENAEERREEFDLFTPIGNL